jgi:hypothetical protein
MPVFIDEETGLPGFTYDIEPETEHVGVVALGDPKTLPDPDKPQPPVEEPEGDPDDNDQPSGNPEDDDYTDPDDDEPNPPAG